MRFPTCLPRAASASAAALVIVALAALAAPTPAQQAGPDGAPPSPTLTGLGVALERGDQDGLSAFWTRVERRGTPLVEGGGQAGHSLVTFLHRGGPDVEAVRLDSNVNALLIDGVAPDFGALGAMERLTDSDVWFLTFRLRNDVRVPYGFEVTRAGAEPERVLDPLNDAVWEPERSGLAASILELPGAPAQPWRAFSESDEGDWDAHTFEEGPDSGRTVYVYKPRAWEPERAGAYPALVGLGAFGHGIGMRVDRLVDHLIEVGRIPPLVVALADLEPGSDATAYRATTDFVADRFLPWLRERYGVTDDPERVVVSGTSRRGMVASLVAFRRPDAAGNVISLSGSYYWRPEGAREYEWVPRLYARGGPRPVRFYLTAGELETVVTPGNAGHYMVATNRRFRDVLRASGYALTYTEFNGVHSELSWQDGLAEGLALLLGRARR